jgi:hypothetical protein
MNIEENAENYIPKDEELNNMEIPQEEPKKENKILKFLLSPTGEGTIPSYINHPLNFKNDNNISQIIRGLTGMLGNLNFALLDIVLGGMSFFKDRNKSSYVEMEESKDNV